MTRSVEQLRADALAIWRAGVDAVRSDRLVSEHVRVAGDTLCVGDDGLPLREIERLVVVGAGKAGAGMARGLLAALGADVARDKRLTGWINVPADCVEPLERITLHAARPAGVNEPTAEGVAGAERILELCRSLGPRDVAFCLLSGGGSALLPAPVAGVSLADKRAVTRLLSEAGANIVELNTVRKRLSQIKGGGLARACGGGRLYTLIISDVLGDPLDVIASGPTTTDTATPRDALRVLARFDPERRAPPAVYRALEEAPAGGEDAAVQVARPVVEVVNTILGNNAVAVDAAGAEAERRGYAHAMISAREPEGAAEEVGRRMAALAQRMVHQRGPDCLISGGEPTVTLVEAERRGRGGRNQQLVLAALQAWLAAGDEAEICILSGGTDGEDGPTDAAGAWFDGQTLAALRQQPLDLAAHLNRNDAYPVFEQLGSLLITGPTHTNVCDVRVVLVDRQELPARAHSDGGAT